LRAIVVEILHPRIVIVRSIRTDRLSLVVETSAPRALCRTEVGSTRATDLTPALSFAVLVTADVGEEEVEGPVREAPDRPVGATVRVPENDDTVLWSGEVIDGVLGPVRPRQRLPDPRLSRQHLLLLGKWGEERRERHDLAIDLSTLTKGLLQLVEPDQLVLDGVSRAQRKDDDGFAVFP
jgi:hypothetical protein